MGKETGRTGGHSRTKCYPRNSYNNHVKKYYKLESGGTLRGTNHENKRGRGATEAIEREVQGGGRTRRPKNSIGQMPGAMHRRVNLFKLRL